MFCSPAVRSAEEIPDKRHDQSPDRSPDEIRGEMVAPHRDSLQRETTIALLTRGGGYQIAVKSQSFAATAAAFIAHKLRAMGELETISIALSGGTTPGPIYRRLSAWSDLPWARTQVFFADERAVPATDPASNYRLARETLLDGVGVPGESIHRMEADRPDLDQAAEEYDRRLPERLDLLILGIGEDGHTASLFPGSTAIGEHERRVVPVEGPREPRHRLTITPPVIARARLVVVLAQGAAKSQSVHLALVTTGSPERCPARLARHGVWILDRAAIAELP